MTEDMSTPARSHVFLTFIRLPLALLALLAVAACTSGTTSGAYSGEETDIPPPDPEAVPIEKVAICVWPEVGLREEPGEAALTKEGKNNYIETIYYGERVEMLGEETYVEKKDRNYLKIRLKDGQEGWVHDFLFEPQSRLAVIIETAQLYRRPDPMTLRNDELLPGEIVAVIQDSIMPQGWHHISGWMKRKKGWARQGLRMSFNQKDVELALLRQRALQTRDEAERYTRLKAIHTDTLFTGSPLLPLLEADLAALTPGEPPSGADKLFITQTNTPLFDAPSTESGPPVQQLALNTVCTILTRGQRTTLDGREDYWYQVKGEGFEGWVFGYYTSRRDLE
ncbi:MAG: hypothetical protein D6722_12540 [Bacteroidetes bacterium]|nr:MAG: hypothetical protein D6722_12540 [Bacteroidota bacterium]